MSRKNRKPPQFVDPIEEMGVVPSTEMTGGIPALPTPMQQAAIFADVFNLDEGEPSRE